MLCFNTFRIKSNRKHITLNKKFNGPDHPFAIEPHEMKDLIYGIRKIEDSLGFYRENCLNQKN